MLNGSFFQLVLLLLMGRKQNREQNTSFKTLNLIIMISIQALSNVCRVLIRLLTPQHTFRNIVFHVQPRYALRLDEKRKKLKLFHSISILNSIRRHFQFNNREKMNKWTNRNFSDDYLALMKTRGQLPVDNCIKQLRLSFATNQVTIVVAATGSGKSTVVPRIACEMFNQLGQIVCTQPRQVACRETANRVAAEMDVNVGGIVGYQFYQVNMIDRDVTKLIFLTDERLALSLRSDPLLKKFSCVIIDEAHTRTAPIDQLLANLLILAKHRPQIKIILMSATLNAQMLKDFFVGAAVVSIPGRPFVLQTHHLHIPTGDWLVTTVETVKLVLTDNSVNAVSGDILVFLPRQEDIEAAETEIELMISNRKISNVKVRKLTASMSTETQRLATQRNRGDKNFRKVILSTNVAETTLTIESVDVVIDTGVALHVLFDGDTRTTHFTLNPISVPSACQRGGRAGRCRPGKVYRLFTSDTFRHELSKDSCPELLTSPLERLVLSMMCSGVNDVVGYNFVDSPDPINMERAVELLHVLGAINDDGVVTNIGKMMNILPLDVRDSRMLLEGFYIGIECYESMLTLVAMLSQYRDVFYLPPKKVDNEHELSCAKRMHNTFEDCDNAGDHFKMFHLGNTILEKYNNNSKQKFELWCENSYLNVASTRKMLDLRRDLVKKISSNTHVLYGDYYQHHYQHLHQISQQHEQNQHLHQNLTDVSCENIMRCLVTGLCSQVIYRRADLTEGKYTTVHDENEISIHHRSYQNKDRNKSSWLLCQTWSFSYTRHAQCVTPVTTTQLVKCAPTYFNKLPGGEMGDLINAERERLGLQYVAAGASDVEMEL